MNYSINIKKRAANFLANLPERDYQKIRDNIRKLSKNPRPSGFLKLTGREG
ncbi:type II toxin-antitoxin system RelE family toxin [Stanieria cyanosphaera]|uniref:type II toxin-antitoxin system RelE family toxin n=1 Tax=Stanieria cyanosphaera TaxID=102116 RepID=UPI0002FC9481|nr:hypothetical protein [Stanieria cyanosphaera]